MFYAFSNSNSVNFQWLFNTRIHTFFVSLHQQYNVDMDSIILFLHHQFHHEISQLDRRIWPWKKGYKCGNARVMFQVRYGLNIFTKQYAFNTNQIKNISHIVSVSDYWPWGHGFDSRHFHNFICELGLKQSPP